MHLTNARMDGHMWLFVKSKARLPSFNSLTVQNPLGLLKEKLCSTFLAAADGMLRCAQCYTRTMHVRIRRPEALQLLLSRRAREREFISRSTKSKATCPVCAVAVGGVHCGISFRQASRHPVSCGGSPITFSTNDVHPHWKGQMRICSRPAEITSFISSLTPSQKDQCSFPSLTTWRTIMIDCENPH
ncbi:hypothetical protein BS17DRAFT_348621 [Gyrodon lividus]|nr:hypothetical protein BS17DRAFT_348621 [Gyrodon lividus]